MRAGRCRSRPCPRPVPISTSWSRRAGTTCWPVRRNWRLTRPAATSRSGAAALAGWIPAKRLPALAASVAEAGGALVPLRHPRGIDAPTLLREAGAAALAEAAGPDIRDGAVRRHRPHLARLDGLRPDVRHDVRRRGAGRAPHRGCLRAAGRLAALGAPVPVGLAVRRRRRPGGHPLRRCSTASSSGQPGSSRRSGSIRSATPVTLLLVAVGHRRDPAGRAPTRSARSTGGGKAAGRSRCTPRRASREPRSSSVSGSPSAGGTSIRPCCSRAGALVAVAGLALALIGFLAEAGGGGAGAIQALGGGCSTWSSGWAPTSCRSPGWPRSA